jgi:bifunctional enzyme CysN/CysC
MSSLIKVMTCGSVDDGKSTLLGRLLYETGNIFLDQSSQLEKLNSKYGKSDELIDYSLFLDGLIDEKKQGITIDLAYKYFTYNKKDFVLIDSPGHQEYTRNTANACTFADVALILVDVKNGLTKQSKKHIELVSLFPNIKKVIVCINKIDKVNYSVKKVKEISLNIQKFAEDLNLKLDCIIPVSALYGDNIVKKSQKINFYKGESLLDEIYQTNTSRSLKNLSSTVLVNSTIKQKGQDRIVLAKNYYKKIKKNEKFINITSNQQTVLINLYKNLGKTDIVNENSSFSFNFKPQINLSSGDILISNDKKQFIKTDSINIKVIWTSQEKPLQSKRYTFKFRQVSEAGFFSKPIVGKYNINDIFDTTVELETEIYISEVSNLYEFSQLIIVDPITNQNVGFGYVNYSLDRGSKIVPFENSKKINPELKCFWFTGLSGSGKTTLAKELKSHFQNQNINAYILDGDNLRKTINKDLGFTPGHRFENNRRIAHISKILFDSGVIPIVATISPNQEHRRFARSLYPDGQFIEIFTDSSIEKCVERDIKGLYASSKVINNITGIGADYDIPIDNEITLDTENSTTKESFESILKFLNNE